ncbi:MAG: glycosyltransferase [Verrucomicrobiaceae bacterium]|nr:glycosyltransferase [Verrucomicrobiaceae bacterium]
MTAPIAQPQRILFIIAGLGAGGAEAVLSQLVRGLDPQRFDPCVISFTPGGRHGDAMRAAGVDVQDLGMKPGLPTPGGLWRMLRIAREFKPDLLCGWMQHGNLAASVLRPWLPGKPPILWNVRQAVYSLGFEKRSAALLISLLRWLSRRPAAIICNSSVAAEQLEQIGYSMKHRRVIANGFNPDLFRPDSAARSSLRGELGLPVEAKLIGRIGRNDSQKDNGMFLRAMAELVPQREDLHIVMAGSGIEPGREPLATELQPHAAVLNGRLHLLGERSDVPRVTAALDISVSSSFTEGFPNVVGEAMACGVPPIATDVGDADLLMGQSGICIPARDSAALVSACTRLLDMPEAERTDVQHAARQRIIDQFSIQSMIEKFQSLFTSISQTSSDIRH